jgi:octaprenyl-diphosphate synthase
MLLPRSPALSIVITPEDKANWANVETSVAVIVPFESPGASIEELVGLVAADMERVNATILSRTGSEVTMIPEVANHLISSGGKRLRPMLTLAMAGLAGYSGDGHIKLAASVEFMHTATLLHDDVVDESELRRGKLSARMLWGNEASVLVGDFLLGQAFRMMVEVGSLRALDILSSAAATIAEGEVMQLAAAKNTATTEDEYLAVIRGKTAELFAAACEVGPVLANRPKAEQTACRSVGMNLGIAFQLVDDVLDYGGKAAKLGKNIGDDFREGKITLPVVLAFRRGNDVERGFWIKALERGEHFADDGLNAQRRRFQIVRTGGKCFDPVFERPAGFRPSRRPHHVGGAHQQLAIAQAERPKHVFGRHGNARIDQHAGHLRQGQRQQRFADAGHHAGARGQAHRHVGPGQSRDVDQADIIDNKVVDPRQQAQRRGGVRRTAADAGRDRQHLVEGELAELEFRDTVAEQLRGLENQIVGGIAAGLRQRTRGIETEFGAGDEAEPVGNVGERHHAFELVVAVDATPDHPQGQVDLGTRVLDQRRHWR